jgi:hypothetical protein
MYGMPRLFFFFSSLVMMTTSRRTRRRRLEFVLFRSLSKEENGGDDKGMANKSRGFFLVGGMKLRAFIRKEN